MIGAMWMTMSALQWRISLPSLYSDIARVGFSKMETRTKKLWEQIKDLLAQSLLESSCVNKGRIPFCWAKSREDGVETLVDWGDDDGGGGDDDSSNDDDKDDDVVEENKDKQRAGWSKSKGDWVGTLLDWVDGRLWPDLRARDNWNSCKIENSPPQQKLQQRQKR